MLIHVGIDDTDSKEGMCTTYVGAVILDELEELGIEPIGYPHLIRLNPNWKWKTRGNCSVSFVLDVDRDEIEKVKKVTLKDVEDLAELHVEETTPGVVFFEGEEIPSGLKSFSRKVVKEVMTMEEAEDLAGELDIEVHKFREGRGIIGAMAAIGHPLENDYTYELIAYRIEKNRGTPRRIKRESVQTMNDLTYPDTFDNLDLDTGEIRITPHTPCPILYGIRSETPDAGLEGMDLVEEEETVEQIRLFKTNQATDEHLQVADVEDIRPYISVVVEGTVSKEPKTIEGGHVFFSIRDDTGEVRCAAFEPTRRFRDVVRKLVQGDRVKVYGGVKDKPDLPLTVNLEKIEIMELQPIKKKANPICKNCGKRMKSAGRDKGYVCDDCGLRLPSGTAEVVELDRELETKVYEVPPRARRHLAKPLVRGG